MKNKVLEPNQANFKRASQCVKAGGVIVTPSDTNLALTLDPWNEPGIDRAFAIKKRPADSALTLFFLEPTDWKKYGQTTNEALVESLVQAFWPGPLNIILEAKENVPKKMLCGGTTVALGCLSNPVWRGFMQEYQAPVTMTSANLSGQAKGVLVDLELALDQVGEKVDYLLAGSSQGTTVSSTILDLTKEPPVILRQGDLSPKAIQKIIGYLPKS